MSKNALSKTEKIDLKLVEEFRKAKELKTSIEGFVNEFLLQFVSEQTQRAYAKDLQFFFDFLKKGGERIEKPKDIGAHHFRVYRDHLINKNYSSSTINRRLVCIRSFIKWAIGCQLMDFNPLDQIKLPKVQTEAPTIAFTDEEVVAMINAPEKESKVGRTHRLIMMLLFGLGLRRSELAQIKRKDFYQERGHLVLNIKGKGGKLRDMPIPQYLQNEILDYQDFLKSLGIEIEPEDYLIQSQRKGKNTNPIDGSSIFRVIEKYAKICGIAKRVSPHSCRATAISHLLDTQKIPIRDVAIFAGHSHITTTERYDKRRKGLDDNAAYLVNYEKKIS